MIGKRIAKLRKEKRWTQADLANAARLSKGYITAIEEGEKIPRIKALARIAECLDADLGALLREGY